MRDFRTIEPGEKISNGIQPYVTFPLLNACTEKCVYCGDGAEMTLCDVREFAVEDVLEWHATARSLGIDKFRLTGGETLLHHDFKCIVRTIADDAAVVLINTNGTVLQKFHDRWEGSPSNCRYVVNYHGDSEQVYDQVSRTSGFFPIVREGIEALADVGLLYRLNTVYNKFNAHEIWDIIEYCKCLGTDLKIQDVVSVPWAYTAWHDVYIDTTELEREFERKATRIREHQYAMGFGTPTKIYTIDGVNITLKSVRNGSHYDLDGVCSGCPYYPCHEGVYDLFVFPDNSAWACNWTTRAKAPPGNNEDQLKYMIGIFQRSVFRRAGKSVTQMQMLDDLPAAARIEQVSA